jgi:hypothetical protein
MVANVQAEKTADNKVVQTTRVKVNTAIWAPRPEQEQVGVGDLVYVRAPGHCPAGSVGYVRELGADWKGDLTLRIDLVKLDPLAWPTAALWVYPDNLWVLFTEDWATKPRGG